jgi:signal transduction histidine kinase
VLNFSQLIIGSKEIFPGDDGILSDPIWKTEKIKLAYNQNSFSVDFIAVNYNSSEAIKYLYQLENFDHAWNNLGTDHKAYFFNVLPGRYTLRVRAINSEGTITEKTLSIIISPPWWKTWWAYCLYALLIGGSIWAYIQYRSKALRRENLVLEQKVEHRTKQLQESIESLKATQTQLIQSEKMASLGELTAGIAHEIQNPLNFVNNFSEVNTELIDEAGE